jgi:single-stranded-DNA-specific exonuclease
VFACARGAQGELRGSGRAIPGLHLRDALDLVSKREPGLLLRFGGHAAAAGLTLREADLQRFEEAFEQTARAMLEPAALSRTVETDGTLESGYATLQSARRIDAEVWGQGFPAPLFDDEFAVEGQRLLKDKHLKLVLRKGRSRFDAIRFNCADPAPPRLRAAYRLTANEFNGAASVQLVIEYAEPGP